MTLLAQLLRILATGPSLTILSYHRVRGRSDRIQPDYPTETEFASQLKAARCFLRFVPLAEGWEALRSGSTREHLAAVTFDDGYRDNLEAAQPVLEALRVPATIFLSTAFTLGAPFFVDLINESMARTTERTLLGADLGLPDLELLTEEQRKHAAKAILELVKYRSPQQRDELAAEIQKRLGVPDTPRLLMNVSEIREAHERGLRVAAHMHRHAIMTTVSDEENRRDLTENLRVIESITGVRPREFAYPNGRPGSDFTGSHRELLEEMGIQIAVTTKYGVCTPEADPMLLPRYTPWDRNPITFALRLFVNILQETRAACALRDGKSKRA